MKPRISFLYFDGCPLAPKQLGELEIAVESLGRDPATIEQINIGLDETDDSMKGWGSPTILVDGKEIEGGEPIISTSYESFSLEFHDSINKIIHSIPRLKIILVLNHYSKLTFRELQDKVGLTPGHLGKQLDKLSEAGYIVKRKDIIDTKFVTTYEITPEGVQEFRKYASIIKPYLLVE